MEETDNKRLMGSHIKVEITDIDPKEVQQQGSIVDELNPRASRTLFIGAISTHTDERTLRRNFKEYGTIVDIEIKRSQAGVSQYAFMQFDCIDSVVKAIKNMDGESIDDVRIKCGFGKSMMFETLWLDGLRDDVREKDLADEFKKYSPLRVLLDTYRNKALIEFTDPGVVKTVLYDNKTKVLPILRSRVKMDFASKHLIEDFTNNMVRKDQRVDWMKIKEKTQEKRQQQKREDKEEMRYRYENDAERIPREYRNGGGNDHGHAQQHHEIIPKIKDEDVDREELDREFEELKKENIRLINEMSNEKATRRLKIGVQRRNASF